MIREIDLKEVSDGKLYNLNDMVKADCGGCSGCSSCCRGMGNSIILDPLDIHRLSVALQLSFEQLLAKHIELNVVDGIILPNLKMEEQTDACSFLDFDGRCTVHNYRPGICRIFPLGRYYENDTFQYFLQIHECPKPNKTKVKVRKWIDTPNLKEYEQYITDWHYFLKNLQNIVRNCDDDNRIKEISMSVLKNFYLMPYEAADDFYLQFYKRLEKNAI